MGGGWGIMCIVFAVAFGVLNLVVGLEYGTPFNLIVAGFDFASALWMVHAVYRYQAR